MPAFPEMTPEMLRKRGFIDRVLPCGHTRWMPAALSEEEVKQFMAHPCATCEFREHFKEEKGQ